MTRFNKYVIASAFLTSVLSVTNVQAFWKPQKNSAQTRGDVARTVILAHGTHNDCQKGKNGYSHWHKGMKGKKVSCPGGKK